LFRRCSIETKAGLIAVVALTVTLLPMWLTLHAWLKHERQLVQQAAGNDAMNLAVAFEEHVHSVVRYADALLLDTREHLETDPDAFQRLVHRELHRDGNMVAQFALIDADGRLAASSIEPDRNVDLSDREHFRVHRDHPGRDELFVSKPVLGRVSGIWSIQITRAVFKHGAFDGVIVLSLPVAFFTDFYKQINVGQRGLVALVGLDGVPRAVASRSTIAGRLDTLVVPADRPYFDPLLPKHGFHFGPSAFDQTERLTAYRRLPDAGLVVLVQLSPADYLAAAEERRQFLQFCAAAISALLLAFAAYLYFATRRHLTNTAALRSAHDSLQQIINVDLLTGARSRRDFLSTLDSEMARAQRHQTPLSLVLLDIDFFKRVNDTFGHPIGDVVLRRLSEICRDMLRSHDVFGRLGGEEFGLLLPHTDGNSAMIVADKLRMQVEHTVIETERGPIRISLSAGIASADQVGYDPARLIVRADDALYSAKQTGRNKVCLAPTEESTVSLGISERGNA